jgi:hypothetical protein
MIEAYRDGAAHFRVLIQIKGCPSRVKNGPDALEIGRLYYRQRQTSVSYTPDCDVIACCGGAKLVDMLPCRRRIALPTK